MGKTVYNVVKQLSKAMVEGRLDVRGETQGLSNEDARIIPLINSMIDAMVAPMMLAGNALDEIAHGNLPAFVIDEYQGEYNKIKQNINTLLAILYGMHGETAHLVRCISEGKLRTRGNDWDYAGIWKEMIGGMNNTLDAVIAPINEAGEVLEHLARYELNSRMNGKYRGDHAVIRKAMNTTAEALNDAISQVSESVYLVSAVGSKISQISATVSAGAEEQNTQLNETSAVLSKLSETAKHSASKTKEAHGNAKQATEAILSVKDSMNRMVGSMSSISDAADSTASIAEEIDDIARETGQLAGSAVEKAARMRTSAGGFGVVASEIRKLSRQCSTTAKAMKEFETKVGGDQLEGFSELIANLLNVARLSNLLGVNAAIEAAHVEGAGNDFQVLTDEIHRLAVRSAEAARRAGAQTLDSVNLSKSGVDLSNQINQHLEGAVSGASAIAQFADEISKNINEQTTEIELISKRAAQITQVTVKNSEGAAESMHAAKELENQVQKLEKMVNRFTF
jgi:methyl-accepting chemotaxis protein